MNKQDLKLDDFVRTANGIGKIISIIPDRDEDPSNKRNVRYVINWCDDQSPSIISYINVIEKITKETHPEYFL